MNNFRKQIIDELIHYLGFEHPYTVEIAKWCESLPETEENDAGIAHFAELALR